MKSLPKKANLSKSERKALEREIKEEMLRLNQKYENDFDVVHIFVLNECLGLGGKRIKRLYHQLISKRIELRRFYADDNKSDDKIDIFAMQKKLERKGIYVSKILEEVMQERLDEVNELNNRDKERKQ